MISQQFTCVKTYLTSLFNKTSSSRDAKSAKRAHSSEELEEIYSIKKVKTGDCVGNLYTNPSEKENAKEEEKIEQDNEERRENDENSELTELLNKYKGKLIEKKSNVLKLSCQIQHKFSLTIQELREGNWCKRCEALLKEAKTHAIKHQGDILNAFYEEFLCFLCVNQHIWRIHNKSWKNRWCSKCLQQNKEEEKKRHYEENIHKEKILESHQSKLFEEAKRKYCENYPKNNVYYESESHIEEEKQYIWDCYKKIDQEAEELAKKQAEKIVDSIGSSEEKQHKIKQSIHCFKVLLIPREALMKYMSTLKKEDLKQQYHEMIKMLHPDKNPLPQARPAFLKYHEAYELALNLLN